MRSTPRRAREIPITTFKANCLALVAEVHRRGKELVITKHGRPVARLISAEPATRWRSPAGGWKGRLEIRGDVVHADWSSEFEALR